MLKQVTGFLPDAQLVRFREKLDKMKWEDGKLTAGAAIDRKNNEQLTQATPAARPLLQEVSRAVMQHPAVRTWAEPLGIARIQFARYGEGMFYRTHNDSAITMVANRPSRADVSFTIFLNDPSEYRGGELVIEAATGEVEVKAPAGTIVLYDTGLRHRVETIDHGERIVVVGWLQSMVRSPQEREVLRDMSSLIRASADRDPDGEEVVRLRGVKANLLRMWADV